MISIPGNIIHLNIGYQQLQDYDEGNDSIIKTKKDVVISRVV